MNIYIQYQLQIAGYWLVIMRTLILKIEFNLVADLHLIMRTIFLKKREKFNSLADLQNTQYP